MPFTTKDVSKHTKKATTDKLRRRWVSIANGVLDSCIKDGGTDETCAPKAIRQANGVIAKEIGETDMLGEAKTKKMGNRTHTSGDFLVVGDEDKPSTWNLPVKIDGKPDRKLAGQAWAALFNPDGFRGNKYEGPNIASAKRKLKALYKAEDWETPTEETAEFWGDPYDVEAYPKNPVTYAYGARTFTDIMAAQEADALTDELELRVAQFNVLICNIMFGYVEEGTDRIAQLRSTFDEFVDIIDELLSGEPEIAETDSDLAESFTGDRILLLDADITESDADVNPARAPLDVEFVLIRPGFGNSRDNHYYPREVLERDAGVFEGVKMYATDHRPEEKSVRTEVAVIKSVDGFTEDGAPIGRATIFDPSFAESTRNRDKAGLLKTLECSILAKGKVREGEVDGRKANIVEAITSAISVDLVTRAGAGGHASALAESSTEESGGIGSVKEKKNGTEETPQEENVEEVETTLEEGDADQEIQTEETEQVEDVEETEETEDAENVEETDEAVLSPDRVSAILSETSLPESARELLAGRPYADEEEIGEAVQKMIDVLKTASRSGEPFEQGETRPDDAAPLTEEQREQKSKDRFNRIMREVGGREV